MLHRPRALTRHRTPGLLVGALGLVAVLGLVAQAEVAEAIDMFDERPAKPFDRDTEVRLTGAQLAARGATDLGTALVWVLRQRSCAARNPSIAACTSRGASTCTRCVWPGNTTRRAPGIARCIRSAVDTGVS